MVGSPTDRIDSIPFSRLLVAGLFLLLVSGPMVVFMIRAVPETMVTHWGVVPAPELPDSIEILPSFSGGGFDVTQWLWSVLGDLLWVVYGGVYYFGLAIVAAGVGLMAAGSVGIADPRAIAAAIGRTLRLRIVRVLLGFYAVAGVAIFFPAAFLVGLEALFSLGIWLALTAGLGVAWQRIETRRNVKIRIAVGYPLLFALVVVPILVATLASPTVRPLFVSITADLVGPVFGGLGAGVGWVDSASALVPIHLAYVVFWIVAAIGMGWTVGILTEGFVWALPRLVDHVAIVGRRGVRVVRRIRDGVR